MSNKKLLPFWFVLLFLAVPLVRADQVVLKEGKILNGTITDETPEKITIDLGAHMVLHVNKSEIKSILRDPKPVSHPPFGLNDAVKKTPKTPLPQPSPVNNITEGSQTKEIKKENIVFFETVNYTGYPTSGPVGLNAHPANLRFDCFWEGKIGKEGNEFKWTSLILRSTTSVSAPRWDPMKPPEPELFKSWNDLVASLQTHTQGHIDIYSDTANAIGSGLISLQATSEADLNAKSKALVKEALARAEKKQRGYDRRENTRPLTTTQKKN